MVVALVFLGLEEEGHLECRAGAQSCATMEEQRGLEAVVEAVRSEGRLCSPGGAHGQVAVGQLPNWTAQHQSQVMDAICAQCSRNAAASTRNKNSRGGWIG